MRLIGTWAPAGDSGTWAAAAEAHPGGPRALMSVTQVQGSTWTALLEMPGILPVACAGWSAREGAQAWCWRTATAQFTRLADQVPGQPELPLGGDVR